jgi:hypothetical protein
MRALVLACLLGRDLYQTFVSMVVNLRFHKIQGIFSGRSELIKKYSAP